MALRDVGLLWQLARRVEGVFEQVEKATVGLAKVRDDLSGIERRMTALESDKEKVLIEARAGAAVAASGGVTQHLVDMARRIGVLEAGQRSHKRLQ
jgi:hypothetical protein